MQIQNTGTVSFCQLTKTKNPVVILSVALFHIISLNPVDPNTDKIYIQNIRIKLAKRNVFFSDRIAM
jgi:hypothetical protein